MSSDIHPAGQGNSLATKIRKATGVALDRCYQCGKCAAGCPVAGAMDLMPCECLRLLQYELPDLDRKVLQSESIWLCLSCATCYTRCPQQVDIPKVMDFLRSEAIRQGLAHPKSKDICAFHRAFLGSIEANGRLYEVGLLANYKLRTAHFIKDIGLAPTLYRKGKLKLLPHSIKDKQSLKRIFKHTAKSQG